jgi:MSHA biogenesis protein MshI
MFGLRAAKRENGWMAVVPVRDRIDLAHVVRREGARPEIRLLESFRVEPDVPASLQRLRTAKHLDRYACTTLLAAGQYHLAQIETPPVPAAERADALRWRFKDMVDFPVEGASIGVLDIPLEGAGSSRQPMVYAVAASAATVGSMMQTYGTAKLSLDAIDIPELAQRNVAALFETENRGLAFLHLDEAGGLLTITYRGELYAVRKIEVSAAQLADADADRRAQLLERVMLELQRTLDNFDRQYSFISVAGLLVAACPAVPELQAYLADNLYVPIQLMDLANACDFPSLPELRDTARQAQCLHAIGAALRTPGAA